ncbi:hypothetical protein FE783_21505 [Paenibacillus mesophilus]|uniref:glycosyl hydrolase family 28-related protein n=1 Tax=Paenibacillus mesophilus TaxID=2582849 RepID=UPI00110E2F7F|nr:glycosyl hydrolase family 28-related protein [Paenibacillus mesophilus]TMV47577.1 hypothetical protein FE783_21505 [Paenibacillus mesophilus]
MPNEKTARNPDKKISRRKLLASLGVAGAAVAMGGMHRTVLSAPASGGASVVGHVYGGGQGSSGPIHTLLNGETVVATALQELRTNSDPAEAAVYFVRDKGQEGCFIFDPADDQTADDNGMTVVSVSGARFKRIVFEEAVNVKWFGAKGDGLSDDTAAVRAAIGYCISAEATLLWPSGKYVTTASLTGLHAVRHAGSGKIVRGADNWPVQPKTAETRRLYVDPAGSDANDGLSAAQPLGSLSAARDLIEAETGRNVGFHRIVLAPGIYSKGFGTLQSLVMGDRPIYIDGPNVGGHPNVPTAIVDMASTPSEEAFAAGVYTYLIVSNVKVINAPSGTAFYANGGTLSMQNCHTKNCLQAGVANGVGRLTASGGLFDGTNDAGTVIPNCRAFFGGLNSFLTLSHTSLSRAALIQNYQRGIVAAGATAGHFDYTRIHDCGVGIEFTRGCGAPNTLRMQIYRCGVGVKAYTPWFNNGIDFGVGTVNACAIPIQAWGNASDQGSLDNDDARSLRQYSTKDVPAVTGSTSEKTLWTPVSYKGGYPIYGDTVRLKLRGPCELSQDAVLRVKIGSSVIREFSVPAGTSSWALDADLFNTGASDVRHYCSLSTQNTHSALYGSSGQAIKATGNSAVTVSVQLGYAGDRFTVGFACCDTTLFG